MGNNIVYTPIMHILNKLLSHNCVCLQSKLINERTHVHNTHPSTNVFKGSNNALVDIEVSVQVYSI